MLTAVMLPARRSDLPSRIIDDEAVILDRQTGQVHRLNATATCIWNHCDGKNTPEDIGARVVEAFEISPEEALTDVMDTIEKLRNLGLLLDESAG